MTEELAKLSSANEDLKLQAESVEPLKNRLVVSDLRQLFLSSVLALIHTLLSLLSLLSLYLPLSLPLSFSSCSHSVSYSQEVQQKYEAMLQMYGEKAEETEELKLDIQDVKTMYRQQVSTLGETGKITDILIHTD